MARVVVEGLTKRFGRVVAVQDFSLEVGDGELVSLLGPSGCGKTTVLRSIAGFERPDAGRILVDGEVLNDVPPEHRGIGMVFQTYALFPHMTVAENIAFPLMIRGRPKAEQEQTVREMVALVHLEGTENRYPHHLSGGERQRVALARALAMRPRVLLLDEPLSALDAKIREELRGEIRRIQKTLGTTTLYVTHDQEEALVLSDRVVVMNMGRIEQVGTPLEIYNAPRTPFVASFVGMMNLLSGQMAEENVFRWREHRFSLHPEIRLRPGEETYLAIRPERLKVITSPEFIPPGWNAFSGQIEWVTFLGPIGRLSVRSEGEVFLADMPSDEAMRFPGGASVWLSFAPESAQVIPKGENG
jgi:ABC-type Fe3+/spermidine/putrescine transport system ATPase subunit